MGDVNGALSFGEDPPGPYDLAYLNPVPSDSVPLYPSGNSGNPGNQPWWSNAITGTDLDSTVYPPLTYIVERVLTEGSLTLLAGPPKAGKSFLAYGLACGIAAGGKALDGLNVNSGGEVLLISLDDQSRPRAQRRLRSVMQGEPIPNRLTLHTDPTVGVSRGAADNISQYLDHHQDTRLVIIDTLEHLRGTPFNGESPYTADVKFLSTLRTVLTRHPKVTLLVLVHTRKSEKDDPISAVSGTHGVTGGADSVLVLTGKRGVPKRILDVVGRDGEDERMVLVWTEHGLSLTDEDADDPTLLMTLDDARVYREVEKFDGPVTAKDLETVLGMPKIGNRLAKLASDGHLRKKGRGVYELS